MIKQDSRSTVSHILCSDIVQNTIQRVKATGLPAGTHTVLVQA